ncbi:TonB-dependent siderophore receptor [Ferruginibacter sp.]
MSLFLVTNVFAQKSTLKGTINTTDGQAVAGVSVAIKELKLSAQTDEDGHFILANIKPGSYTITVSHVGLVNQEKTITLEAGKTFDLVMALQQSARQLEEVTVTSDKTSVKRIASFGKAGLAALDNPQSIGIITNTVITDQQVQRLGDVVKNVSGVSLTQQRQGVAETFSARGYSIGIGGGTGSIFKNGITSNTGGFPEASTLESIEVLKGSSALLYGNTSGGVVINMVTKKPKFNWGGEVSMRAGSNGLYKPIVDVYGPISKKLAFRVVSTYENAKSYRDVVKTERTYINPSLLYKISNKTSVLIQGDYLDADFTPDNGIGVINQNVDAVLYPSRSRFINTPWAWYKSKTASASVTVDHNFNSTWKLNFVAAGQSVLINSFGTAVPNAVAVNGDWTRTLARAGSRETNQTLQANLTGKFNTGVITHQVLVGTDYVGITTRTDAFRITSGAGVVGTAYDKINILDPNKYVARIDEPNTLDTARTVSPSLRLGYYAQDLVGITSKLKVLVGLRWSYLKTQPSTTTNYIKNTEVKGTLADYRAFSPKAALMYQPTENMSVYASYSSSFSTNTGTDIYLNALKPSLMHSYELGWKNIFYNGKLTANLSLYKIYNNDLYQTALFNANGTANTNTNIKQYAGSTLSDGLEVDFSGTLSKNIYFMAGYGYNNARYTKSANDSGSVVQGDKLINNPANTANATIFYTFDKTVLKGLKVGLSGFYTGTRYGGNQNTVKQTGNYNRQIPLSDFTTVDISLGYTYKKVSLLAKLSNIGNTLNYLAHDRYSINPIPPRQLITTLSYKF